MGTWNVSITGNDTAQDLRSEYSAVFFKYDPEEGSRRIDEYVRAEMFDESDEEEWSAYVYSLADYMWKKGILTDEIKTRAIQMIDSGFGLELWSEAGPKTLEKRKRVLAEFKEKLESPMPPKKKIRVDVHTKRIFEDGDFVAIQLQTAGKPYTENDSMKMSDEEFHTYDGKYVILQIIDCYASWSSAIAPDVKDYWGVCRLFEGIYDEAPQDVDLDSLKLAKIHEKKDRPFFICESCMVYFKRRNCQVLGSRKKGLKKGTRSDYIGSYDIYLGINRPWYNPDSRILAAMGRGALDSK